MDEFQCSVCESAWDARDKAMACCARAKAREVLEFVHRPTIERCIAEIDGGLDVHRWLKLWESGGKKVDEAVAIAFYHQALQDAREALATIE